MIKIVKADYVQDRNIALEFSDGSAGILDFSKLLAAGTSLTKPLEDTAAFQRFFLELGALCWPSGLEFSARSLQERLRDTGNLKRVA